MIIEDLIKKVKENKGLGFFGITTTKEHTNTVVIGNCSNRQVCEVIIYLESLTKELKKELLKNKNKNDILFSKEK